jgi:WD40 repeat protein
MKLANAVFCFGFVVLLVSGVLAADAPDFAKDVAPILTKYCAGCHNDADREGKLSLQSYESLLKGGEKGGVVTPGQVEVSRLVRVITGEAKPAMPPEGEEKPKAAEIEVLKNWIAAGAKGPSGSTTEAVKLVTPKIKLLAKPKLPVNAVALSPDGKLLAIARHGEVELQSLPGRNAVRKLSGMSGAVNSVAFSPDGQFVVAAAGEPGLSGEAALYSVANGEKVKTFRGHKDSLYCARLSPDGKLLATAGYDGAIKLWNAESGKEVRTLEGHNGPVFEVAFRADGKVLASASGDRTVKLWNVTKGERLDTLKESQKELYAMAFNPDGTRLAAAGVDNRIRVWQVTKEAKEGENPLLISQFAHETPVLRVAWSGDGQTVVSAGEDRLIKVWNADTMTIRQTLERQSDWASGLAISGDGRTLAVGRVDGSTAIYPLARATTESEQPLVTLAEVPAEVDYGPQPAMTKWPKAAEREPNDEPAKATEIATPGVATGRIFAAGGEAARDQDLFRFTAKAGDQWIVETKAARDKSPLDSKVEVLDQNGQPVPRLLLRAVRDSVIEFRGMNSEQRGVRLANWEEMLLNEYVYLSGDVIKLFQQRRGPDADAQFYPENGNRFAYFETTSRAHNLGEPGYIVVPYAVGTELPNNGLPVFTLFYENDDEPQRKLGKDSKLTFVAPADGTYFVRVTDVRGFSGEDFKYELTLRRPMPDFKVSLTGNNPTINVGSGKPFTMKAERIDNFNGPIRVDIENVPPGFQVTTPIVIQEGHFEAAGLINALPDATAPTEEQLKAIKITATATVCGTERTKDAGSLGTIKTAAKAKVIAHLTPSTQTAGTKPGPEELPTTSVSEEQTSNSFPAMQEVTIAPSGKIALKLRAERNGFADRIAFEVANLPHGIIVDDIGLSGVLIPENQTERTIFLRAEPWVPEQTRPFFATAQVEGNQCSLPMLLTVKKTDSKSEVANGK